MDITLKAKTKAKAVLKTLFELFSKSYFFIMVSYTKTVLS